MMKKPKKDLKQRIQVKMQYGMIKSQRAFKNGWIKMPN